MKISTKLSVPPTPNNYPPNYFTTKAPRIDNCSCLLFSSLDPKAYLSISVSAGCIPTTAKEFPCLVKHRGEGY